MGLASVLLLVAAWAPVSASAASAVKVSNAQQLFFGLTNSSVLEVQLTRNINLNSSILLWSATGGPVQRTTSLAIRGTPSSQQQYWPELDLQYLLDLIRLPPGTNLTISGISVRRVSTRWCGLNLLANTPQVNLYMDNVWTRSFLTAPYEQLASVARPQPSWYPNPIRYENLTQGFCAPHPVPKCYRAYMVREYACDMVPTDLNSHSIFTNYLVTSDVLQFQLCPPNAEQTALCANLDLLDLADRLAQPQPVTAWCTTAHQLLAAVANNTVDLVLVTQDIVVSSSDWDLMRAAGAGNTTGVATTTTTSYSTQLQELPVAVAISRTKNITIRGAALPGVYPAVDWGMLSTDGPDIGTVRFVNGSGITFEQLLVKGLQAMPRPGQGTTTQVFQVGVQISKTMTMCAAAGSWCYEEVARGVTEGCYPRLLFQADGYSNHISTLAAPLPKVTLTDSIWHNYLCPPNYHPTTTSTAATQPDPRADLPHSSHAATTTCVQRPHNPVVPVTPAEPGFGSLAAFPPSSYQQCWEQAWAQTAAADAKVLFTDSFMVCERLLDPACYTQWQSGRSQCFLSQLAAMREEDRQRAVAPAPEDQGSERGLRLVLGLVGGLAGVAGLAAVAVSAFFVFQQRRRHSSRAPSVKLSLRCITSSSIGDSSERSPPPSPRAGAPSDVAVNVHSAGPDTDGEADTIEVRSSACAVLLLMAERVRCTAVMYPPSGDMVQDPSDFDGPVCVSVPSADLSLSHMIGQGTLSSVHKGEYRGHKVAVKVYPSLGEEQVPAVKDELLSLGHVCGPHLLPVLGARFDRKHSYLIQELCGTTLEKTLYGETPPKILSGPTRSLDQGSHDSEASHIDPLPEQQPVGSQLPIPLLLSVAIQIAQGLSELHPHHVHGDLKPSNVMICSKRVGDNASQPSACGEASHAQEELQATAAASALPAHSAPASTDSTAATPQATSSTDDVLGGVSTATIHSVFQMFPERWLTARLSRSHTFDCTSSVQPAANAISSSSAFERSATTVSGSCGGCTTQPPIPAQAPTTPSSTDCHTSATMTRGHPAQSQSSITPRHVFDSATSRHLALAIRDGNLLDSDSGAVTPQPSALLLDRDSGGIIPQPSTLLLDSGCSRVHHHHHHHHHQTSVFDSAQEAMSTADSTATVPSQIREGSAGRAGEPAATGPLPMPGTCLIRLTDYSLLQWTSSMVSTAKLPVTSSLPYMAPELLSDDPDTPAEGGSGQQSGAIWQSDMYSFGVVLWELVHGCRPWLGKTADMILHLVNQGRQLRFAPGIQDRCPPPLQQLIKRCLSADPQHRPSAQDALLELRRIANALKTQPSLGGQRTARSRRRSSSGFKWRNKGNRR